VKLIIFNPVDVHGVPHQLKKPLDREDLTRILGAIRRKNVELRGERDSGLLEQRAASGSDLGLPLHERGWSWCE
jgi:hypothetical protein